MAADLLDIFGREASEAKPSLQFVGWAIPLSYIICKECGHTYEVPGAPLAHWHRPPGPGRREAEEWTSRADAFPLNYLEDYPFAEIKVLGSRWVAACHRCRGLNGCPA